MRNPFENIHHAKDEQLKIQALALLEQHNSFIPYDISVKRVLGKLRKAIGGSITSHVVTNKELSAPLSKLSVDDQIRILSKEMPRWALTNYDGSDTPSYCPSADARRIVVYWHGESKRKFFTVSYDYPRNITYSSRIGPNYHEWGIFDDSEPINTRGDTSEELIDAIQIIYKRNSKDINSHFKQPK